VAAGGNAGPRVRPAGAIASLDRPADVQKRIIINAAELETRVALVEGNQLAELQIESRGERSIVGNIYKGKVLRVLPGMQAAFVDIGLEKAAFMHVSDFWSAPGESAESGETEPSDEALLEEELELEPSLAAYADEADAVADDGTAPEEAALLPDRDAEATTTSEEPSPEPGPAETGAGPRRTRRAARDIEEEEEEDDDLHDAPPRPTIEEVLSKGQEILVQVSKEPIGSKGARITSHISLPGRYVVYMPTTDHIGVSRRIEEEKERKRLRDIVAGGRGKVSGGFIVRTACEGVSKREIVADMRFLSKLWSSIVKKSAAASAPALLHEDLDIVLRAVRDLFTSDVAQVVVDRATDHQRIIDFVDSVLQPRLKTRVEHYREVLPVFERFGIENQVHKALERRVWLKSGGYLVFDQTEALTTIDVNTGRFVGKKTQEETVLKTNLEAARVAIDQLRLRNIGGIIIIDFIDMEKATNRKKVSEALAEAVKRDKARTNILRISELGLVQMTRKRTRDNLRQLMTVSCPTCAGDGRLRSVETLAAEAMRSVRRAVAATPDAAKVAIHVPTEVGQALRGALHGGLDELGTSLAVDLAVHIDARLPRSQCDIEVLARRAAAEPANADGAHASAVANASTASASRDP
jgi:ribonuclease G